MKIIDRMNPTLTSEYYGVINGVIDPKTTHYFANTSDTHNARKFSKAKGFMCSRMANLSNSPMVDSRGVIKEHNSKIIGKPNDDQDIDHYSLELDEDQQQARSSFSKFFRRRSISASISSVSAGSFVDNFKDSIGSFNDQF